MHKHVFELKINETYVVFVLLIKQLLPENVVDPMELLSYLDPEPNGGNSSLNSTVTSNTMSSTSSSVNDDLLSLFET
jgi:hypothetical protein